MVLTFINIERKTLSFCDGIIYHPESAFPVLGVTIDETIIVLGTLAIATERRPDS